MAVFFSSTFLFAWLQGPQKTTIYFVIVLPPDSDLTIILWSEQDTWGQNKFGFDLNLTTTSLSITFHLLTSLSDPKMT